MSVQVKVRCPLCGFSHRLEYLQQRVIPDDIEVIIKVTTSDGYQGIHNEYRKVSVDSRGWLLGRIRGLFQDLIDAIRVNILKEDIWKDEGSYLQMEPVSDSYPMELSVSVPSVLRSESHQREMLKLISPDVQQKLRMQFSKSLLMDR